jgi:glycosyltransferase involved in cell wall biosynthesis
LKIVHISPGSGDNFYCENCLRDAALVKAMRRLGHDVIMVPLYLPLQSDKTEPVSNAPLFFGGVNVYLQQKLSVFRKTPRWIDRVFDSRKLLEWAGHKAGMTSARDLGETTISMLQGEHGNQIKELDRLVDWLQGREGGCDIVSLSNVLLAGLTRRIKDRLGVPVVCWLQDEDGFLDGLTEPYAGRAWDIVRQRSRGIDGFVAVSRYFGLVMQSRLNIEGRGVEVVRMGIDVSTYAQVPSPPPVPTIGYLSRMCPDRGLETLVDAFILLKARAGLESAKLRISGGKSGNDERFIRRLVDKLEAADALTDVEFLGAFDGAAKQEFLRSLSVLSVPERQPVAYGLYALEAMASGVPIVQPAVGCFPEMIENTGGGVLYEPNTPEKLAEALAPLLLNPEKAHELGVEGRKGIVRSYDVADTAVHVAGIYEQVCKRFKRGVG